MELTEEEFDYNMIVNERYGIKTLERMKDKYKDKPYMMAIIETEMERKNEHDR